MNNALATGHGAYQGTAPILHIVDDEKFIDAAWRICEAVSPGRHRWIMFADEGALRYVKSAPVERLPAADVSSAGAIRAHCTGHRVVVMHSLNETKLSVLRHLPGDLTVWWLGWGFDYYDLTEAELYLPLTQALLPRKPRDSDWLRRLKAVLRPYLPASPRVQALRRIDFFGPVIHEEFDLVRSALPGFGARYLRWNYGTLEDDMIRGFEGRTVDGDRVLLGNSATVTNNHLDAFELLRGFDLSEGQVIVPLSYGSTDYLGKVEQAGREAMGAAFRPLKDFMPIDEYVGLLSTCNAVIMNHLRQQALGNIVIMLYLGAKVFLDRRNPLFSNLRAQGAHVFATEQFAVEWRTALDDARRADNRSVLRRTWSRRAVFDIAGQSLATVESYTKRAR